MKIFCLLQKLPGLLKCLVDPGATQAEAPDIPKAFDRVLHAGLIEYFVGFLALLLHFTVKDGFGRF